MYALLWRMGIGGTLANGRYAVGASSAASLLLLVPVPLLGRCIEVILWKVTCMSRVRFFFGPTDLAVRSFSLFAVARAGPSWDHIWDLLWTLSFGSELLFGVPALTAMFRAWNGESPTVLALQCWVAQVIQRY